MIELEGKQYYTSKELAAQVETTKGYICRLAREGRIRHERTSLGYMFPLETAESDWDNRSKHHDN